MTSKIVVNNIESDSGISSVTLVSNIAGEDSTQNISGINSVTATTFHGDGSQLSGISVDSTKIETGNTKVETIDTGSDGHIKFTTEGGERSRISSDGHLGINTDFTGSQLWRAGKRLEIFGGSGNVTGELHLGANRGDGAQSVGSINFFDNTQDSTHRHIAIIEADKAGSTSNKRGGDILFYTKDDNVAAPTEKVRIKNYGGLKIGPEINVSGLSGDGSELNSSSFTNGNGGLVLVTPAYAEYQYTWTGQNSYVITLTCGSYFHSEFIYVQHQTNGGSNMQNYARGKWANNHTQHTGYMYEFSGQGTNAAVTTTFTVSDQNDNGTVNLKAGLQVSGLSGATTRGEYGGGSENFSSGTGSATGKFVIDETYNGSGLSASTRALIMRVYFGSFNISIDDG